MRKPTIFASVLVMYVLSQSALLKADPPSTAFIFPAGGQRGTTVDVRIGGYNLHDSAMLHLTGAGITAPKTITRTKTVFFEGPVIPQPASQGKEDYPRDYAAKFQIAKDASLGTRRWRVSTSQGVSAALPFIVGDLPEAVEREIDGAPIPTAVTLPITINGRIFPREDVDVWTFHAKAGQTITCEVTAARLGSGLDSRLEIRGPTGERIAENVDAVGTDSRVSFTAPKSGRYSIRIHDVNFDGRQNFVYRLTVTAGPHVTAVYPLGGRRGESVALQLLGANLPKTPVSVTIPKDAGKTHWRQITTKGGRSNRFLLDVDDLPELIESAKSRTADDPPVQLPAILNGRISKPGEVDIWSFDGRKGEKWLLDLKAARLGTPLDSVLTIVDEQGKSIASSDDMASNQTDSQIALTLPKDGRYRVTIEDRLKSRGGPTFAYRLRIAPQTDSSAAGFDVTLPNDALSVNRGKTAKLKLNVDRRGGFKDEIELNVTGLPNGVTFTGSKIGKNKRNGQITFTADKAATVGLTRLKITAKANVDGKPIERVATVPSRTSEPPAEDFWLAVAVPTPFKFSGVFETKYAPRGSTYYRHYTLERNGFDGPITIMPADIQIRHLQGTHGPMLTLPPGVREFDYPISLPPWMEIGRTSRTCIMAVGVVTDKDGTKHKVSYSSTAQNDQILLLVDPGRLSVRSAKSEIRLQPGSTVSVPVEIGRGNGLTGPVTVELVVASHMRGVNAKPVVIPAGQTKGQLSLQFAAKNCGPFNMPLILRATLNKGSKHPFVAETLLPVVVDGKPTPLSYFASWR